jgi:hypothetical protein
MMPGFSEGTLDDAHDPKVIFGSFFVALFPWALQIIRKSYAVLHWLGSNKGRRGRDVAGIRQNQLQTTDFDRSVDG